MDQESKLILSTALLGLINSTDEFISSISEFHKDMQDCVKNMKEFVKKIQLDQAPGTNRQVLKEHGVEYL